MAFWRHFRRKRAHIVSQRISSTVLKLLCGPFKSGIMTFNCGEDYADRNVTTLPTHLNFLVNSRGVWISINVVQILLCLSKVTISVIIGSFYLYLCALFSKEKKKDFYTQSFEMCRDHINSILNLVYFPKYTLYSRSPLTRTPITRTTPLTRTESQFPWIWTNFSVIFTRITRTPITRKPR